MSDTNQPHRPKVLAIGLDGATYRLIRPMLAAGQLPNLARLMAEGVAGELRSTIQPSSEQAWAAFLTGQNNGKHGVFGFQQRRPGTYQFGYVNAASLRAPSLWHILSQRERDVIVMNVPMTYPPEPVRGVLVGGLLTPGTQSQFTYPDGIYDELVRECGGYMIDVDTERGRLEDDQLAQLADDGVRMIQLRTCAALHLAKTRPWDFFMVVFGASDRLAHKFWKHWDVDHPLHEPQAAQRFGDVLPRIYRELDAAVGQLVDALQDDQTTVFVLSDHGFGPLEKAVYLNRWLAQQGYLVLRAGSTLSPGQQASAAMRGALRRAVRYLDTPLVSGAKNWAFERFPDLKGSLYSSMAFSQVDWSRTQAYALGTMGNIYFNRRGREPEGIVAPGAEADALAQRLMRDLYGLHDPATGQPVFHEIYRAAELYSGPALADAPDVIGVKQSRYHVVTADWQGGDDIVVPLGGALHFVSDQSGQHELAGILMASGPDVLQGQTVENAHLVDVAATILYALDEPIPASMDSRVIEGVFTPGALQRRPPQLAETEIKGTRDQRDGSYNPDEEARLAEHLASLGYLD
ncbi:MAG: alkaline phosphatase family protein [Anaerolineae bacterium]|nr:alkaline phosphatase family protein [Anaerolineae bacterium]